MAPKSQKDKRKAAKKAEAGGNDESLKGQGDKAYLEGRFTQAVEFYTKSIAEEKNDQLFKVYANRSAAYAAQKMFTEALADAEIVVKTKSDFAKGYFRQGVALEGLLRLQEAADAFQKGLEIDPKDEALKTAQTALQALMKEMAETKKSFANKPNPEKDRFDIMIDWMKAHNAKMPYLYLQYYAEDYRGVHALTRIPNDTVILEVPNKLIMTSEVAKDSDIGKKIINSGCKVRSTHSYLAAFLCQEKYKKNSFWKPYIDILPQAYRNMPIFFDESELQWLKGSFSLKKIADRKEDLLAEYENICKFVPEFKQYSYKDFVWARLAVITRIFGLVIKGNKTDGLVPMADMLNHKRPRDGSQGEDVCETSWTYDDKRDGFTITSLKALARGEEIFDSYGRKCNSRFFVNYGFSLEENEDNQAVIPLNIPPNDPQFNMKLRFLGGHPSQARRRFQIPVQYKEKETKEAFSFGRFAFARDKEIMMLGDNENFKIDDIEPLSIRNEIEVLKALSSSAKAQLANFETTLEEDMKMYEEYKNGNPKNYSFNLRNALLMRRGEKQVLQFYVELADKCIKLLNTPWKDLKKIAAKSAAGKDVLDQYITMVIVPLVKSGSS